MIEKDHLGEWSPEKDGCWRLTFRLTVRKPSSESSDRFSQLKFKNPGERFDWSIDRVAFGKPVMWLAVKTCAVVGYVNWGCTVNDKQCVSVSC